VLVATAGAPIAVVVVLTVAVDAGSQVGSNPAAPLRSGKASAAARRRDSRKWRSPGPRWSLNAALPAAEQAFDPESRIGVILLRNYDMGSTPLDAVANQTVRILAPLAR
jgi:hypothetical protein